MSTNRISDENLSLLTRSLQFVRLDDGSGEVRVSDLAADLLDARRENAALVERNLVLQAKVRGVGIAGESPPPGAGALVAYLRHMAECANHCQWSINGEPPAPRPHRRCDEGQRLAAAVPPLDAVPINGSTWWAVVPAKGAPETAYRNRVDAVRFVRECGEAGDTIRPLSVPPLDEAGAHAAAGGDADDFDLTLLLAPLRDHDGCNHDALVDEVETKIAARLLALRAPTPAPKCTDCDGEGRRMYANTAGARGGIGGQQFTDDVCSTCKGSGEAPAGKDRT